MIRYFQNSFIGGEISPELSARTDFEKFPKSAKTIKNWIVRAFGGATKRTGFKFIAESKTSSKTCRVVTFSFGGETDYVIEVGDQYMRFYYSGGQLVDGTLAAYEITTPYLEADIFDLHIECQSADVLYIFHNDYYSRKLERRETTTAPYVSFTLSVIDFTWGPFMDTNPDAGWTLEASGGAVGTVHNFVLNSPLFNQDHIGSQWRLNSGYFTITLVGSSTTASGLVGRTLLGGASNDWAEGAFSTYRGFPSCGTFYDDRLVLACTKYERQRMWGSVIGDYYNHASNTLDDDGAWRQRVGAHKANRIRSIFSAKNLLAFTTHNEWWFDGSVTPSNAPRERESAYGSAGSIFNLEVGHDVLYLQKPGKQVRVLRVDYDLQGVRGYRGDNLSLMAEHLTQNYRIVDWAYQAYPNQIVWSVRDDGVLLGLTYVPHQNVYAWYTVETDGEIESVTVAGSDDEDIVYVVVKRTINGTTKRFIEYMPSSFRGTDTYDAFFVDSGLSYNGDEFDITGITLTSPVWLKCVGHDVTTSETVRITGVSGTEELNFNTFTVGATTTNFFALHNTIGASMTAYTGSGVAQVATSTITATHLPGESVSVLVDGSYYGDVTLDSSGKSELDLYGGTIHAGLSFVSDIETFDPEFVVGYGTIQGEIKRITGLVVRFFKSVGCWVGPDEDHLKELRFWSTDDYFSGAPPALFTGDKEGKAHFPYDENGGKIFIRHTDPLPCTVLGVMTEVEL